MGATGWVSVAAFADVVMARNAIVLAPIANCAKNDKRIIFPWSLGPWRMR